jgi:3-hydroxyisobutyrate dehydrogenase-like beta-hydroxyacid dehydrogenase
MADSNTEPRAYLAPTEQPRPVADVDVTTHGSRAQAPQQGKIAFIGLGRMGTAMAANLAAAGHQAIAYVRRPERMDDLRALGLCPTLNIADLYESEIVITMLPDDAAVREVTFGRPDLGTEGLAKHLAPGAVHLSMSTISTATSSELAAAHARFRQGYVAAPVFGNPDAAKARQLYIIAGGAPSDVARCQPIFDALGQRTFLAGPAPATANLIKLAGNAMSAATLEILGEVLALARKRGLDPRELLAILTATMFGSRVHRIYGAKIAEQQYTSGGFVFPLALKDIRLALGEADAASVPMPSLNGVHDRLLAGIARGYSALDWTALGLLAEEDSGLVASSRTPASLVP